MPDQLDTYGHKPSADELLHDLARLHGSADVKIITRHDAFMVGGPFNGSAQRLQNAIREYKESGDYDDTSDPTGDEHSLKMEEEHAAWLAACAELKKFLGDDLDEPNNNLVVAAIQMWGECLADLRANQTWRDRGRAYEQRESKLRHARAAV